jgi:hypothetical protein
MSVLYPENYAETKYENGFLTNAIWDIAFFSMGVTLVMSSLTTGSAVTMYMLIMELHGLHVLTIFGAVCVSIIPELYPRLLAMPLPIAVATFDFIIIINRGRTIVGGSYDPVDYLMFFIGLMLLWSAVSNALYVWGSVSRNNSTLGNQSHGSPSGAFFLGGLYSILFLAMAIVYTYAIFDDYDAPYTRRYTLFHLCHAPFIVGALTLCWDNTIDSVPQSPLTIGIALVALTCLFFDAIALLARISLLFGSVSIMSTFLLLPDTALLFISIHYVYWASRLNESNKLK